MYNNALNHVTRYKYKTYGNQPKFLYAPNGRN